MPEDQGDVISLALAEVKPPAGHCIGCGSDVRFSVFIIATTKGSNPRLSRNTKAMGVCSGCCDPESPHYRELGRILAVQIFSLRNSLFSKLAEVQRERVGQ